MRDMREEEKSGEKIREKKRGAVERETELN